MVCFSCLRPLGIACGCGVRDYSDYVSARVWFDGGSRGNPGPAAGAAYVRLPYAVEDVVVASCIGEGTSNQAEFMGAYLGLKEAAHQVKLMHLERVFVFGDNRMVVSSLRGDHCPSERRLRDLHMRCRGLILEDLSSVLVVLGNVPREGNVYADAAVNAVLDMESPPGVVLRHQTTKRLEHA